MKLHVLGSSSKGNCYLFVDEKGSSLMVECGISPKKVVFVNNHFHIDGCLVTHEHQDHAKHVRDLIKRRIPVYMSKGTADKLSLTVGNSQERYMTRIVHSGVRFSVNDYVVLPFDVQHDAAEPLGFLINHPEMGTTLFATDTYYLKNRFRGLSNILIECNYSSDIVNTNVYNGVITEGQRNRVFQSHMSFQTCMETLQANDIANVNNIVLIHLSGSNSDAEMFRSEIAELTGKATHVARTGLELEFNKTPF